MADDPAGKGGVGPLALKDALEQVHMHPPARRVRQLGDGAQRLVAAPLGGGGADLDVDQIGRRLRYGLHPFELLAQRGPRGAPPLGRRRAPAGRDALHQVLGPAVDGVAAVHDRDHERRAHAHVGGRSHDLAGFGDDIAAVVGVVDVNHRRHPAPRRLAQRRRGGEVRLEGGQRGQPGQPQLQGVVADPVAVGAAGAAVIVGVGQGAQRHPPRPFALGTGGRFDRLHRARADHYPADRPGIAPRRHHRVGADAAPPRAGRTWHDRPRPAELRSLPGSPWSWPRRPAPGSRCRRSPRGTARPRRTPPRRSTAARWGGL